MSVADVIERARKRGEAAREDRERRRQDMPETARLVDAFRAHRMIAHIRGREGAAMIDTGRTPNRKVPTIPGVMGQGDVWVIASAPPKAKR